MKKQRFLQEFLLGVLILFFLPFSGAYAGVNRAEDKVFEASWYLNAYSDLKAAFGNDLVAATNHWLNHGLFECRQGAMGFSALEYIDMYPDLNSAFGASGCAAAIDHYLNDGARERRAGRYVLDYKVFNPTWYLERNPDLKAAFGTSASAATRHWLLTGTAECRQANPFFASRDYLNKYGDLASVFGMQNCAAAVQHFVQFGAAEGRFVNPVKVHAGGVFGFSDLKNDVNSRIFRSLGGGLYIHASAWDTTSDSDKKEILGTFRNSPVALEFGYNQAWGRKFVDQYAGYGIQPRYVTANAFDNNTMPTLEGWKAYIAALRAGYGNNGIPASTKIYPTFEYQNYHSCVISGTNCSDLLANTVSNNQLFKNLIMESGGIVLDTPPDVALNSSTYREWLVDAIKWTRKNGYTSIVIVSPHTSGNSWSSDTDKFINFLIVQDAIPNEFVSENYNQLISPYPNFVGSESSGNTTMGVGLNLLRGLFGFQPLSN